MNPRRDSTRQIVATDGTAVALSPLALEVVVDRVGAGVDAELAELLAQSDDVVLDGRWDIKPAAGFVLGLANRSWPPRPRREPIVGLPAGLLMAQCECRGAARFASCARTHS